MGAIKHRNNTIDIFRYFCALLIVGIHTAVFSDISSPMSFAAINVLSRIAVPFFFAVAGYYFSEKLLRGEKPLFGYLKRQLLVYAVWSIFYFLLMLASEIKNGFETMPSIKTLLYDFFIRGSIDTFWFFPALMISAIVMTVFFKLKLNKALPIVAVILYIIGSLGMSWVSVGTKIPVLKELYAWNRFNEFRRIFLMGLPFFTLGYIVQTIKEKIKSKDSVKMLILLAAAAMAYIAETLIATKISAANSSLLAFTLFPLVALILINLLLHPCPKGTKAAKALRVMASFTYLAHPLLIDILSIVSKKLLHITIPSTPCFLTVVLLTAIGGFLLYKINNKVLNKLV